MCYFMLIVSILYTLIFMFQILSRVELTAHKKDVVLDLLDKIILYQSTKTHNVWSSKGAGLQKFSDLISILFSRTSSEGYKELDFKKEFSAKYRVKLCSYLFSNIISFFDWIWYIFWCYVIVFPNTLAC